MTKKDLKNFFEGYMDKETLFLDKTALQSAYAPKNILHRDKELKQVADILAPALRGERPSNIFVYGKTGTGKTLAIKHLTQQLKEASKENQQKLNIVYINCKLKKIADTEYRLIAQLGREFGREIPVTGLPTDEVYKLFYGAIDKEKQTLIIILDEIDQLIKKTGDAVVYNLTRINEELTNAQLSIIGVSNDLMFTDNLDPRARSSLSEEEVVFPPYNALQLRDILNERVQKAFNTNVIVGGVIEKCAAYAAREHGDARRALDLLRVAAEMAERENKEKVEIKHIDVAENRIEDERITELIKTQPKQFQVTLYSIILLASKKKEAIFTGEVYELYKKICDKTNLTPLTQRRVSDIISELDMLGIIHARVLSKGRYGRTREISLSTPPTTQLRMKDILIEALGLG